MNAVQLTEENLTLVHYLVHKYAHFTPDNYDDYYQTGCLALWEAAQRFDESRGTKFVTFASSYIIGYLRDHYNRFECNTLKVPRGGKAPVCISLQEHYGDDSIEDLTVGDTIPDNSDVIGDLISDIGFEQIVSRDMTEIEARVLRLLLDGKKQRQIAAEINVCQTTVSRAIKRIKSKFMAAS